MSDAYSWAIRQQVGHGGRKSVLLFMATHATFTSAIADMSSELIATTLEYSDSSIRKWLTELEEMGLVEKIPQYRADGWQLRNLYRLNVKGTWIEPDDPEGDRSDSRNLEPAPAPQRKARSRDDYFDDCLKVYQELRADNWTDHSKLTGQAVSQLKKLRQHFPDDPIRAFRWALLYAKDQSFWTNPNNTFSLVNLGSNDKLIDMAEKYHMALQQKEERLFSGPMTAAKAKEIVEKYPDKPVTEAMWAVLSDDDKLKTIQPGQTRRHDTMGPVLVHHVEGNKVICQRGATTQQAHVRHFTHEVLEEQVTIQFEEEKPSEPKPSRFVARFDKLIS